MKCAAFSLIVGLLLISCNAVKEQQFQLKKSTETGIDFSNTLTYTEDFNPYTYRNFFNGGGVALGDINNDGLVDIYFTGNIVDNKLYLNKGNWQFEDITNKAGVSCSGVWSTGATFVDINQDGLLDLYVCKSGKPGGENRHNELFINNGDNTFSEQAKTYGLDVNGLSVHAAFFDYDSDGDLDCYVLNNSMRSVGGYDLIKDQRNIPDQDNQGNKLFENRNGKFIDVTLEQGIYTSAIGFGLGITLSDFNNDRRPDLFISNDFFERDYYYLNTSNGFKEVLEQQFNSISMGSMGADAADLDNDLNADLFVTEMLPRSLPRQKSKTKFDSWDKYELSVKNGYFHQYPRNALQRNLGTEGFVELSRMSGVAATEWSWGALIFDMDNDGRKDIFIANGIYKDLLDRDYLSYMANTQNVKALIKNEENPIEELINIMPSKAVPNAAFKNLGAFKFKEVTPEWGLETPSFSNGNAYGDLDNDGDLDLVINNVNMPAFVYENTLDTLENRSVTLALKSNDNTFAVGAKAIIKHQGNYQAVREQFTSRGFQSSVPNTLHFGVGNRQQIDSLILLWPNGTTSLHQNITTNKRIVLEAPKNSNFTYNLPIQKEPKHKADTNFDFTHKENYWIDFNYERLLPFMHNNEGPALAVADVNADGVDDFYIGGAKNQAGSLFVSAPNGKFEETITPFDIHKKSEDVAATFIDVDQDGDLDLYVASGGKGFSTFDPALNDRVYINTGMGTFKFAKKPLPYTKNFATSTVAVIDVNKDGKDDLFVGKRFENQMYGPAPDSYLLLNEGEGTFRLVMPTTLKQLGMVRDAAVADINQDSWPDIVIVGEWIPITVLINQQGILTDATDSYGLSKTSGLWNSIELIPNIDTGGIDFVAGNHGENTFFKPNMRMYINDFDNNGTIEQIICQREGTKYYPIIDKEELISQLPSLKKKIVYFKNYAQADMTYLFEPEQLNNSKVFDLNTLSSQYFQATSSGFKAVPLPDEIQYAPVYSSYAHPTANGYKIYFGGNQYLVKPQFGRYDASKGWVMPLSFKAGTPMFGVLESLNINGQIRQLKALKTKEKKLLLIARNNETLEDYELE